MSENGTYFTPSGISSGFPLPEVTIMKGTCSFKLRIQFSASSILSQNFALTILSITPWWITNTSAISGGFLALEVNLLTKGYLSETLMYCPADETLTGVFVSSFLSNLAIFIILHLSKC